MRHLTFGGSTAERTLNCPAWIQRSKGVLRRPAGAAALEGSMHHHVQEQSRLNDNKPSDYLGLVYEEAAASQTFTDDDLPLAQTAYDLTEDVLNEYGIVEFLVEPFVQWVADERGGSIDMVGLSEDRRTLLLLDYKFGRVRVSASKAQMPFYVVCLNHDPKFKDMFEGVERIICVIVQPRVDGVSVHEMNLDELAAFEVEMDSAIEASKLDNARATPGDHCLFCPASPYCKERRMKVHEATLISGDNHNALNAAAGMVEEVEGWLKSVKEEMHAQMSRGVSIDGWKLVAKRAQREWEDEAAVMAAAQDAGVLDDIRVTGLKSVAQAEKALKGSFDLEQFVKRESRGTTIATVDDKREPVVVTDVVGHLDTMMKDMKDEIS